MIASRSQVFLWERAETSAQSSAALRNDKTTTPDPVQEFMTLLSTLSMSRNVLRQLSQFSLFPRLPVEGKISIVGD
jgi:hypothetical protein